MLFALALNAVNVQLFINQAVLLCKVYTVEQALSHFSDQTGIFAKNLFLRDKKKSLWLYCAPHFVDIKLSDLAKKVGAPGGLRFADEEVLINTLGVRQGCVTVFGLVNDPDHKVKLILDQSFWEEEANEKAGAQEGSTAAEEQQGTKAMGDVNSGKGEDEHMDCKNDSERRLYFHPLVNSSSTGITVKGLKAFLEYTGHKPVISS